MVNTVTATQAETEAERLGDLLVFVNFRTLVDKVVATLAEDRTEMKAKALVDSFIETLAKGKA